MSNTAVIILTWVFILGIAFLLLLLAYVPGHVARRRKHPSAQAISICGVLGLLIWPLWLVAYVWAYTGPDFSKDEAAPSPAPHGGLACDGCSRPLAISQARQIGTRLMCPTCAMALDGGAHVPQVEQFIDADEELRRLAANPRRRREG